MYIKIITLSLLFSLINPLLGQSVSKSAYISPIKPPFSFSGGFGELRRNHFHTGLDFRTAGQIGFPVFAVKEGYIARVSVSPAGYGHALYLLHPDGHTTVYGHLSRFHPKIENYLTSQQYLLKQFAVDLTVPEGLFSFKKGEIIAWSGNTGSSGGPHLHFEIRDTRSEKPQNPLFFLSGIHDNSAPRITSLYLYPLSENSQVNRSANKQRVETISSGKNTRLKNLHAIEVFGEIGLGIQSDDDFNGVGFKCGIYSAEMYLDGKPVFSFKMDHLAFDQGRFVNSHIDYEELIKNRRWVHKLYLQPGNKMDIYHTIANRGILKMTDGQTHTVKVIVADAYQNTNEFKFKLISKKSAVPVQKENFTRLFYFDRPNNFENKEVKIQIPEGALYDQLKFNYHSSTKTGFIYSKIHHVHNPYVPVHKSYNLSIKTLAIPPKYQGKALIVLVGPTGRRTSIGGEYADSWVTAHPLVFGDFGVVLDTIPPRTQSLSIKDNKTLTNPSKIEFKISDNLSGIKSYEGEIDGNWVLFEYDAKTGMLVYTIDKNRLVLGKKHRLNLKVVDERKNATEYKANFYL